VKERHESPRDKGCWPNRLDLAAEAYADAIGGSMSSDSLRRITEGWGRRAEEQRRESAERANAPAQRGKSPQERRVDEVRPITGQANLSTDGGMVLIRDEMDKPCWPG
jgi:hypothetical protein